MVRKVKLPVVLPSSLSTPLLVRSAISFLRHNFLIATVPFFVDGSFTLYKLVNALAFIIGMECWNQMFSEQEDLISNRNRPKNVDKGVLLFIWSICLLIGAPIVKLWCIVSAIVYCCGASSPLKEMHMIVGVAVHFSFLNLPIHPITLIRHALMLCIQDVPDVKADAAVGRMTLPILFSKSLLHRCGFQVFYSCLALLFGIYGMAPLPVTAVYLCIAVFCQQYPVKCYKLWKIAYVIELCGRCHGMITSVP